MMITVTIDGHKIEVPQGYTVMQACEKAEKEIPLFCYHPKLSIAGNCRMCLVEIEKMPKLAASCAMPAADGMVIHTQSEKVKKGREGVLELLLLNHPLDCPVCDQGGECDLQDLSYNYGKGCSKSTEDRRTVKDKYIGPLVGTVMNRCIHCTRCVRFTDEIAGTKELGAVNRGENTEITTYLETAMTSELSGNVIDICPVGALTSKPYKFRGRPWELRKTETIDVMDAIGSHIRVDTSNAQIKRVLPRACDAINEEWISDKTRFSYDGLANQRLDRCYVRKGKKLKEASYEEALTSIAKVWKDLKPSEIAALSGPFSDAPSSFAMKGLFKAMKANHIDGRPQGIQVKGDMSSHYRFNTSIQGIEDADALLIIGSNPRHEGTMINARIRKRYLQGNFSVGIIGEACDLTYAYDHIDTRVIALKDLISNKHAFASILKKAKKPMVILGEDALKHRDGLEILRQTQMLCDAFGCIQKDWNGFNILWQSAGTVNAFETGMLPGSKGLDTNGILQACEKGSIKSLYLMGKDDIDFDNLKDTFIIYQGHHGDAGAQHADVILPATAYTEKQTLYVNLEGRVQETQKAIKPLNDAKDDWQIILDLADSLDVKMPFDNYESLLRCMEKANPIFKTRGALPEPSNWSVIELKTPETLSAKHLELSKESYYMGNVIGKNSPTMAACEREIVQQKRDGEAA